MCKELLSKQHHYDWGLRAMSGVLRIAGGMEQPNPNPHPSPSPNPNHYPNP